MQKSTAQKLLLSLLVSLLLLNGCGQTGDLYLPAEEPSAEVEQEDGEQAAEE